jgi:hypothetical protein
MRPPIEQTGFAPPPQRPLGRERKSVAFAELLAMVGLVLGTIVVATITAALAHG